MCPRASCPGLTPPAKALFVASAAHARPHAVILYVLPGDGDLEEACSDVTFFLAALEGLTPAGVELAVLLAARRTKSTPTAGSRRTSA